MTEEQKIDALAAALTMYPSIVDNKVNQDNVNRANGYIEGYKRGVQDNKWQQLVDRLNEWSEHNEDGPPPGVICGIVWELMNEQL